MDAFKDRAAARQAVFDKLFDEYADERYGPRFLLSWDGAVPDCRELVDEFLEELALRAEGMTLQAFGDITMSATPPSDWREDEWSAWWGVLPVAGATALGNCNRAKLIAIAELLNLTAVLGEHGVVW